MLFHPRLDMRRQGSKKSMKKVLPFVAIHGPICDPMARYHSVELGLYSQISRRRHIGAPNRRDDHDR